MFEKGRIVILFFSVWMLVGCGATPADRQAQIAETGATVMPFDLDRTTHIFEKSEQGGVQQVVSDDGDTAQITLIRTHLAEEAQHFSEGDFSDPAMIHGDDMAGLHDLMMGAEQIEVVYSDLPQGGQIVYTTQDVEMIAALHAWFDQQISDHGAHAQRQSVKSVEMTDRMGMGMGMMGNNSMRTAHHATIPQAYVNVSNPVPADSGSLERGAEIYAASCAVCHGDGGMGDSPAAANLDPAVSPIAQTSQMLSEAYLFWRVSEGGQGDPLDSAMPAWKGTLDKQARWDVINYVQALGQGVVQPRHNMGGIAFDPAVEQQNRLAMLTEAMDSDIISQSEADTFDLVHSALDDVMADTGLRMQGNNLPALLAIAIENATITSAQADTFEQVHELLIEAGLMR